jgi:hypothetical protein
VFVCWTTGDEVDFVIHFGNLRGLSSVSIDSGLSSVSIDSGLSSVSIDSGLPSVSIDSGSSS